MSTQRSQTIKNVVQIGASGTVGTAVLSALLASGKFNVTVLTREESSATFPTEAKVVNLNYLSRDDLVDALKGQDAVVITLGGPPETYQVQNAVVDAAVAAGVPYVVPSSFGPDTTIKPTRSAMIYSAKVQGDDYVRQLTAEGKINHLIIFSGLFLDWGLTIPYLLDLANKRAVVYNDSPAVAMTTLGSIGDALVGALSNPERFANKPIRIHDVFASLLDIITLAEEEMGEKWEITSVDANDFLTEAHAKLMGGGPEAPYGYFKLAVVGPDSGGVWDERDESEALGLTKKDLRTEVVKALKKLGLKP